MDSTTLIVGSSGTKLDLAIAGWLHAKYQHSQSEKTRKAYADTLAAFRAALRQQGLDLDSLGEAQGGESISERQQLTATAEIFASWSLRDKEVALATINQRLSILSSFYEYAIRHDYLDYNPLKRVDRAKVEQYGSSRAFEREETRQALASIDTSTLTGKRDYAVLAVLLATGRRVSEVASLHWRNVYVSPDDAVTLYFPRLKGAKQSSDELGVKASRALLSWLRTYYNEGDIVPDAPLWVSLSNGGHNARSYGQPLETGSFRAICEKYFGTSNVHRTRHTWAKSMQDANAPLSLIQDKLRHTSLATTGKYLRALQSASNPFIDTIADNIGI